ncbi:MAG TPA: MIP/aquaporin family protein [Solirubrobacterales bacterium]|nr:MIP/aquaporin family protein [Solirubrobacterales bacterium]
MAETTIEPRGMKGVWHVRMGAGAAWRKTVWGEFLSEYLGTFTLIAFGDGVVAMAVAALNQSGRAATNHTIFLASGDWLLITWGWCIAVVLAIYVAGGVSGAHINPAVTIALASFRGFPWKKVPHYIFAQVAGAFTAGALVYLNYKDAINGYDKVTHAVRGESSSIASYSIFATFPAPYFHNFTGPFISELIGSALLIGIVLAVIDNLNLPPKGNLAPWIIGLVVAGIGMSYGANTGYAINPARDFGPRLFAWLAGWDGVALPGNYGNVNWYWWLPIVAPIVGGIIGALVYEFFISHVLRAREEPPASDVEVKGEVVEEL